MKRILSVAVIVLTAGSLGACYSPGERAAGGALIGGAAGAAIGSAAPLPAASLERLAVPSWEQPPHRARSARHGHPTCAMMPTASPTAPGADSGILEEGRAGPATAPPVSISGRGRLQGASVLLT
jgi:hypothetical protein